MRVPLLLALATAQAPAELSVLALRVQAPPQVDGLLDEAAWTLADPAAGFRQREPREGEPASEATEVRDLVFNDDRGDEGAPGRLVSRGLAVKGTWLVRF